LEVCFHQKLNRNTSLAPIAAIMHGFL